MSALRTGGAMHELLIVETRDIRRIKLDDLQTVSERLIIHDNPKLPSCLAESLRDHVTETGTRENISDNGGNDYDVCKSSNES